MADAGIGITRVDLGPGVVAGFTNRFGGVSPAPWESLNLGPNVNDNPWNVAVNRKLVGQFFGAPVVFSSQVHGAHIIEIMDDDVAAWHSETPPVSAGEADSLLTTTSLGLGVLVADCVPILLAAPGIVATAHAGRRGVELDVIGGIVQKMRDLGATEIKAAIGPAICGKCYEVPAEMRAEVAEREPKAWSETRQGTPGLDLPAAAADQLARQQVKVVYQSPSCTFEDPNYYSHRRANAGATGRQAGLIRLATA